MQPNKVLVWTDTNISPAISKWLNEEFENIEAVSFYKLNFHKETDFNIFMKAKENNAIFVTKDKDFKNLLATFKAPPYLIFLKSGNISNANLKKLLAQSLPKAIDLITKHNYHIVEIE